jgi:hypothetical protein
MAQSMGVQEVQKSGRARAPLGPIAAVVMTAVAALLLAPAIRAGNAPADLPVRNPIARVAPAQTTYGDWVTSYGSSLAAAKATGRLVGATVPIAGGWLSDARALAAAKAAGFTGRLGAATPATSPPPTVNFTDKLKAGRA